MRGFLLIPAVLLAALVYAVLDTESGIPTWLGLRRDVAEAHERISSLRRETEALRAEAAGLEADPFVIERAIREDLDLAKPGETVVHLRSSGGSNP